ncbi:MAG: HAMP domain-containing histidine kinase [Actinomycetales bacterium]|nr:HAMP domain-containing histidine kinase [Actinomycetales bacterium]
MCRPDPRSPHRRLLDLRPLDLVGSIKVKLGLLVVASVVATALLTWYGLLVLGWWPRYTLPVAVLVSLGVTQALAHGMTSPLRQMTAAAREMAAGRPAGAVRATSRDEVGELARAFLAMSRDLAAVDRQRRELLANVSHELRTPVAALRAQLENLVDGVRTADAEALAELLGQTERLGVLVDDLLDLARAEAGVAPLDRSEVDVAILVADVVRQVGIVRPDRRIAADVTPGLRADADPARLRQVLVNLVDNAARHSPDGGRVDVVGRAGPEGGLVIEVLDDGPGIPVEDREAVFERFQRGSGGEEDDHGSAGGGASNPDGGGTGLGLAIARWAVSLHRGRIAVLTAPGRGCRIRVEIPRTNGEPADNAGPADGVNTVPGRATSRRNP